jgi:hypothetical protein
MPMAPRRRHVASKIEKKRLDLLEKLNNKGRLLERRSPLEAQELNDHHLRKVMQWLAARLRK